MYVEKVVLAGFRGLSCEVTLTTPLSVIVGANNTGKSGVVDALRTVLWPADGVRARRWISPDDFSVTADGTRASSFTIEVTFAEMNADDEAMMLTCLTERPGTARIRLHAQLDERGRVDANLTGGDADHAEVDRFAREAVQWVYLPPLRDAVRDLRPGHANRAAALLRALVPTGHADRDLMEEIAREANSRLDGVPSMIAAEATIDDHLQAMSGPLFAQPSDLLFAPAEFEAIIRALRAHAGHIPILDLDRNGLGYNNLLYMATLLAATHNGSDARLTVMLVEEPEAHLHPQLQDLLMRFLEAPGSGLEQSRERRETSRSEPAAAGQASDDEMRAWVPPPVHSVVTSHSPNVAAAAGAERVVVLTRSGPDAQTDARAPANFSMEPGDLAHLDRYLDVTKASLLFASGVILVEGIAEQLVVPALARQLGIHLHEHGVTVVNVQGLAFGPFVELFAPDRLPIRCALVTDGDAQPEDLEGSDATLSASTQALRARVADWPNVDVFFGETTFEQELGREGEWDVLLGALERIHARVAANLHAYSSEPPERRGKELLAAVTRRKGRYAQALAAHLDDGHALTPPGYIADAIRFACAVPRP